MTKMIIQNMSRPPVRFLCKAFAHCATCDGSIAGSPAVLRWHLGGWGSAVFLRSNPEVLGKGYLDPPECLRSGFEAALLPAQAVIYAGLRNLRDQGVRMQKMRHGRRTRRRRSRGARAELVV